MKNRTISINRKVNGFVVANAVVGVDLDYETVGDSGSMLMVTASGTAVRIED